MLIKNLEDKASVIRVNENEIKSNIINMKIEYAIVFDKGFTNRIIDGEDVKLKSYSIKESDVAVPVKMYIDSFLSTAKNISAAVPGNEEKFYSGLDYYKEGSFQAEYKSIELKEFGKRTSIASLGFLIMCIIFLSSLATTLIIEDKKSSTYYRVFSTPLKIRSYMLQNILSFIAVALLQVGLILIIMMGIFKADLGPSPINVFVVMAVFAIVAVALGVVISSLSKDSRQVSTLISLITIPMCMLGGCFWPREVMPSFLQKIGDFVPTTWAHKAAEKAINGSSLIAVSKEIFIMLLFAVVFFLMSSWRKVDIARYRNKIR
jgi:ABC-2 type transport system permease protein